GRTVGSQSWWFLKGWPTACRPSLDSNHAAIYRRRYGQPAPAGSADMRRAGQPAALTDSSPKRIHPGYTYARRIILDVCRRAGLFSLLDDLPEQFATDGMTRAIGAHDTAALFNRMMYAFSFQGIADTIAA